MRPLRVDSAAACVLLGMLLLVACRAAAAAPGESEIVFTLNPAESHVAFTLSSLLHTIHGTFQVKWGVLRLDPTHGLASGACVVDATSGTSGHQTRDRRMHTAILASNQYPDIVFSPTRVRGRVAPQGESRVEVDGTFTIHGASHSLTATMVVQVTGDRFTASTHLSIPYVQWGMPDPSTFVLTVGKQVAIDFEAAGHMGP